MQEKGSEKVMWWKDHQPRAVGWSSDLGQEANSVVRVFTRKQPRWNFDFSAETVLTSDIQKCQKTYLCCLKSVSAWWLVTATRETETQRRAWKTVSCWYARICFTEARRSFCLTHTQILSFWIDSTFQARLDLAVLRVLPRLVLISRTHINYGKATVILSQTNTSLSLLLRVYSRCWHIIY